MKEKLENIMVWDCILQNPVAKKHGGFVILKNREDKVGAEVSLMINTKV